MGSGGEGSPKTGVSSGSVCECVCGWGSTNIVATTTLKKSQPTGHLIKTVLYEQGKHASQGACIVACCMQSKTDGRRAPLPLLHVFGGLSLHS